MGKVSLSRRSVNVVRPAVVDDPDRIRLASASSVGVHLRETVSDAQLSDCRLGRSIEAGGRHRQQWGYAGCIVYWLKGSEL